ncbi:CBS domain-containing protein [archaeon]|nr:CBS domain-containing protein [archaeon]|tara:strand:- start:2992 stop:3408 length:417 start_codon:yes stop_codon:yes gene_type:complete
METGIKVYDAMSKGVMFVNTESSLKECASMMLKEKIGSLVVKDGMDLVGIITEKDLVRCLRDDNMNRKVREVMTKNIKTIEPEKDIYEAFKMMGEENVRKLPVVDKGKLIGFLTEKDILKIAPSLLDLFSEKLLVRGD